MFNNMGCDRFDKVNMLKKLTFDCRFLVVCQTTLALFYCPSLFEILALTYGSGPYGPGPSIRLKNILSQICSRTI